MSKDLISSSKLRNDFDEKCYGECCYCTERDNESGECGLVQYAPTVDVVEVVRCKDCKRFMWFTEEYAKKIGFDGACNLLAGYTDCDREMRKRMDYCSYGEPWEDAEVE